MKRLIREFPGDPVAKIPGFHCCGPSPVPAPGAEIPQVMQHRCPHPTPRRQKSTTDRKRERLLVGLHQHYKLLIKRHFKIYIYIYIKQVNNFEKIFAIASSEKGLASIIYKEP